MNIFPEIRGSVIDFDVIVVGHLRWNRYFGEGPDAPPRGDPSTCTSTLIKGKNWDGRDYVLVVDPTLRVTPENYYFDINRRTGLRPWQVTHCFSTHDHYDHQGGLNYFPEAVWYAAKPVAEILKKSEHINGSKMIGVEGEFLPGIFLVHIPGHTDTIHGIAFMHDGKKVLVAGDGVMTKYHFKNNTTEFQKDAEMAAASIQNMKESFDIIIPGHDNLILNCLK